MNRRLTLSAVFAFAFCFASLGVVQADELNSDGPGIGAVYFSATNGSGSVSNTEWLPNMQTAGDFVAQTITDGPDVVDSLSLGAMIGLDTLNGYTETFAVYVNGFLVAPPFGEVQYQCASSPWINCLSSPFTIPDVGGDPTLFWIAVVGPIAPIDGMGTYTYSIVLEDTIPDGDGSISLYAVPEPSSIFLLGSGLLGLAGAVRQRMRR